MSKENKKSTEQVPAEKPQATVADQIWTVLKDRPFPMFALPNQKVSDYCQPVPIDPFRCFLTYKVGSVIPMFEEMLATFDQPGTKPEDRKFGIEITDKYLIITKR